MTFEETADRAGVMKAGVVADQPDLPAGVGSQEQDQEGDEVPAALGVGDHRGDLARSVVHGAVHDLLLIFPRRGHARLVADLRPHPRQERMFMDFGFVLEEEDFGRVLAERFFSRFSAVPGPRRGRARRVCL